MGVIQPSASWRISKVRALLVLRYQGDLPDKTSELARPGSWRRRRRWGRSWIRTFSGWTWTWGSGGRVGGWGRWGWRPGPRPAGSGGSWGQVRPHWSCRIVEHPDVVSLGFSAQFITSRNEVPLARSFTSLNKVRPFCIFNSVTTKVILNIKASIRRKHIVRRQRLSRIKEMSFKIRWFFLPIKAQQALSETSAAPYKQMKPY